MEKYIPKTPTNQFLVSLKLGQNPISKKKRNYVKIFLAFRKQILTKTNLNLRIMLVRILAHMELSDSTKQIPCRSDSTTTNKKGALYQRTIQCVHDHSCIKSQNRRTKEKKLKKHAIFLTTEDPKEAVLFDLLKPLVSKASSGCWQRSRVIST